VSDSDTRVTAALAGGMLLGGAIVAAAAGPLLRQVSGGRLAYECTPSGSLCSCEGVFDCLDMGRDGKCTGKKHTDCSGNKCVCY